MDWVKFHIKSRPTNFEQGRVIRPGQIASTPTLKSSILAGAFNANESMNGPNLSPARIMWRATIGFRSQICKALYLNDEEWFRNFSKSLAKFWIDHRVELKTIIELISREKVGKSQHRMELVALLN